MPSARITCPKYIVFCLAAFCLSVISPLRCPISSSICSFVLFSVQETLSILLQIHISHASIFFSSALVFVHASHPYSTTGIIIAFTILVFVSRLTALSFHIFSSPCIAPFPRVILRRISLSHPPSLSIVAPRKQKLDTTSISSPSTSKLLQLSVVMTLVFFYVEIQSCFLTFKP